MLQGLQGGHSVRLLQGGADFFPALIRAVDRSQREVRIETFIFDFEAASLLVAEALERAAARGVAVYLLIDGIGTLTVPAAWRQRFDVAGVQWHRFSPLGPVGLLNPVRWRRLHRKLCVVDRSVAFCGGINFVDDLIEPGHGALDAPRYDFALQLQGPLVADMLRSMTQLWHRLQMTEELRQGQFKAAGRVWKQGKKSTRDAAASQPGSPAPDLAMGTADSTVYAGVHAALLLRDNLRNRARIERAYRQAIGSARHEIIIANAYFLPGRRLRKALFHARRRGVRVQLLLQGRYDNFMQFHASRPVMASLLTAGIEVYEYSASLLHAKVAVIDGEWATVGSSNLDPLSLLLAREANVVWSHTPLAAELRGHLVHAMEHSATPLDATRLSQRSLRHRVLDRLAFAVMRTMLFITGFRY
ncbi:MAG: cardiolipin synthase B [Burkholderiales bacterium PBB3]|nr:MAG: cardiolipin synthase B [Burkholderiales bacterium PBB3]